MGSRGLRKATCGVMAVCFALAVGGCWEEMDRRPRLEKGTYPGEAQPQLSEETLEKLRQRSRIQRGGSI